VGNREILNGERTDHIDYGRDRNRISSQVILAYGALAAVIFALVAGGVLFSRRYIESNTIEIGELQTVSQSVHGQGATSVNAEIDLGTGEITVRGGADELLEVEFTSNVADMHPVVTYEVEDGTGNLHLQPSQPSGIPDPARIDEYRYRWDVRLTDHILLDLHINLGAGVGEFDLSGLNLTGLEVNVGAGEATIDLSGEWQQAFDGTVNGGAGKTTLLLPSAQGVRVSVARGIGSVNVVGLEQDGNTYVNSLYNSSDDPLEIKANVGIGELNLEVRER
jgi:hypothetical protein